MELQDFRLIAAPFTPMRADGSLDPDIVNHLAQHLVAHRVRGAFIGGTTGEGQSLTVDERITLADAWGRSTQRDKLELIVHVGHNCQEDAIRLTAHADSIGADAIAMHAPIWFRKLTLSDLVRFCAPVAAAAQSIPFYLYDMPHLTGMNHSSAKFLASAKSVIPNLVGIKYTNPDCVTAQECIQAENGTYDILWGCDETLLAGLALGAAGAVGSTYNFAAPLYWRILEAVESDDWPAARAEQARAVAMVRVFEQFTPLAAMKFAMGLVGIECGPTRLPVGSLTSADQRRLRTELERLRFSTEIAMPGGGGVRGVIASTKSA